MLKDFPGGPMAKTPHLGGQGSTPGQGTKDPSMLQLRLSTAK